MRSPGKKRRLAPHHYLYLEVFVILAVVIAGILTYFYLYFPALQLQPTPTPLTSCGTLDVAGAHYVLTGTITPATTTCIVITGDGVVLDGDGQYAIEGNGASSLQEGVSGVVVSANNVEVRGLNVSQFFHGITVEGGNGTVIEEVTSKDNAAAGVLLNATTGARLTTVTSGFNQIGFGLANTHDAILQDTLSVGSRFVSGESAFGIVLLGSSNNQFITAGVSHSAQCVTVLENSRDNALEGLQAQSCDNGIAVALTHDASNTFEDVTLIDMQQDALFLTETSGNSFENVSVSGTLAGSNDLVIGAGVSDIVFIDTPLQAYSIDASGTTLTVEDSADGSIEFLDAVTGAGSNLTEAVQIDFNRAEVHVDGNSGLDRRARVTLRGFAENSYEFPEIHLNGESCGGTCSDVEGLNTQEVQFVVAHWTNYSVGEGEPPEPEVDIREPDNNDVYFGSDFPVEIRVSLSRDGAVNYTLGTTTPDIVMESENDRDFTANLSSLAVGNYTLTVRATFETNESVLEDSVSFTVRVPPVVGSGTTSNSGTTTQPNFTTPPPTPTTPTTPPPFGTTSGTGTAGTQTGTSSQVTDSATLVYWILVGILALIILIVAILTIQQLKNSKVHQPPRLQPRVLAQRAPPHHRL